MSKNKVLVIGIDGGTFDLIEPWVKDGKLPTIGELMKKGSYGNLRSTIPPITGAAWTSFMTGKRPINTGIFEFFYPKKLEIKVVDSYTKNGLAIWEILTLNNKKSIVINVPVTNPAYKINGYMLSGIPVRNRYKITHPNNLFDRFNLNGKEYKIQPPKSLYEYENNYQQLVYDLKDLIENRAKVALKLINEPWDFFMVHFLATDLAQHALWKFMDKKSPYFQNDSRLSNGIEEIYELVDKKIQLILDSINPEETTIIIMSDHGFGPNHKNININTILKNKGYLKTKKLNSKMLIENIFKNIKSSHHPVKQKISKILPLIECITRNIEIKGGTDKVLIALTKKIKLLRNWSNIEGFHLFNLIDWQKTKAYSIGTMGLIYLNREILTKEEYKKTKDQLINDLKNITDEKGNYLIDNIYENNFRETHLGPAPDIIPFTETYPCYFNPRLLLKEEISEVEEVRSGNHRLNGIFIATGKNIKKGVKPKNLNIIDVAPTILYLMNIPISPMDGRIIKEIIDEKFISTHKMKVISKHEIEKMRIKNIIRKIKI